MTFVTGQRIGAAELNSISAGAGLTEEEVRNIVNSIVGSGAEPLDHIEIPGATSVAANTLGAVNSGSAASLNNPLQWDTGFDLSGKSWVRHGDNANRIHLEAGNYLVIAGATVRNSVNDSNARFQRCEFQMTLIVGTDVVHGSSGYTRDTRRTNDPSGDSGGEWLYDVSLSGARFVSLSQGNDLEIYVRGTWSNPGSNVSANTYRWTQLDGADLQIIRVPQVVSTGGGNGGTGEQNVQSDWDETSTTSDAFIRNKPTIPTLPTDAEIGSKAFNNPPNNLSDAAKTAARTAIGAGTSSSAGEENVQADWNETDTGSDAFIRNKPARAGTFTQAFETKLNNIEQNAERNVQADWNETSTTSDAFINNKPTIPDALSDSDIGSKAFRNPPSDLSENEKTVARNAIGAGTSSGTGGEENVQSDWNVTDTSSDAFILNKPTLFSGNYNDLTNKPTLFSGSYDDLTNKPNIPTLPSDAEIGSKAFTNPPSNLTDPQKQAVRTAIGAGSATGGEENVQSDWNETNASSDAFILNKPTLFSGAYADLTGKPTLFSGSYDDLTNKPNIPTLPSDAEIGSKAFTNPPSNLTDGQKTAVRNAIGAGTGGGGTLPSADGKYSETIWGEDSGATNGRDWAFNFGNGWNSVDNGILILEDCELTKIGVSFEEGSSAIGTWEIGAFVNPTADYDGTNNPPQATVITTTPAASGTHHQEVMTLDTPLALSEGERLHMDIVNSWTGASPNTSVKGVTGPDVRGTIRFALQKSLVVDGNAGSGEENVQADWNETDTGSDAFIRNKPARAGAFTAAFQTKLEGITAGSEPINVHGVGTLAQWVGVRDSVPVNVVRLTADISAPLTGITAFDLSTGDSVTSGSDGDIFIFDKDGTHWYRLPAGSTGGSGEDNVQADWNETDTGSDAFIRNKPTLFSGAYADLTGKPTLFSGSYDDLTNKPNIPTLPTDAEIGSKAFLNPPTNLTDNQKATVRNAIGAGTTDGGGGEDNVQSDWNVTDTSSDAFILNKPTLFSGAYADLTGKPTLFSGSYDDLTNKPNIPTLPTDAEIGAKAFRNVPGDLSNSEAGTVRVRVGLTNAFIGNSAFTTPPSNLSDAQKQAVRTAIGAGSGTGGEENVQSDWDETDTQSDAFIENKPDIETWAIDGGPDIPVSAIAGGLVTPVTVYVALHTSTAFTSGTFTGGGSGVTGSRVVVPNVVGGGDQQYFGVWIADDDAANIRDIRLNNDSLLSSDFGGVTPYALTIGGVSGIAYVNPDLVAVASYEGQAVIVTLANQSLDDFVRHEIFDNTAQADWDVTDAASAAFIQHKPTDAEIGDKAFSNPPSDLTDTQKAAVRTAIGAGTGGTPGQPLAYVAPETVTLVNSTVPHQATGGVEAGIHSATAGSIIKTWNASEVTVAAGQYEVVLNTGATLAASAYRANPFMRLMTNSGSTELARSTTVYLRDDSDPKNFVLKASLNLTADTVIRFEFEQQQYATDSDLGQGVGGAVTLTSPQVTFYVTGGIKGDKGDKGDPGDDGSGATTFLGLTDTPSAFGTSGQLPAVNAAGNALEFIDAPSGGGTDLEQVYDAIGSSIQVGNGLTKDVSDANNTTTIGLASGAANIAIKSYSVESWYYYGSNAAGSSDPSNANKWSPSFSSGIRFISPRVGKIRAIGVGAALVWNPDGSLSSRAVGGRVQVATSVSSDVNTLIATGYLDIEISPSDFGGYGALSSDVAVAEGDAVSISMPATWEASAGYSAGLDTNVRVVGARIVVLFEWEDTYSIIGNREPTAYWWMQNQATRWPDTDNNLPYEVSRATNTRCRMRWGQTSPREDFDGFATGVSQNIWVAPASVNSNIDDPNPGDTFQVFTLPAGRYDIAVTLLYDEEQANYDLDCSLRKVTAGVDDVVLSQNFGRQFGRGYSVLEMVCPDLVLDGTEQLYVDSYVDKVQTHRYGGFMKIQRKA